MTGIGPVAVRCPRCVIGWRRRGAHPLLVGILPSYARGSKSLEVLIRSSPSRAFPPATRGGADRAARQRRQRALGHDRRAAQGRLVRRARALGKRDLSAKRYVYFWVDGIHVQARLEDAAQCLLVIIGATPEGKKEFVGLIDGVRESARSWRELLLDLKRRGLAMGPSWRSPMARSASGRRSRKCGRRPAASAAGAQDRQRLEQAAEEPDRKPSARCRSFGWPRPRRMRSWRSMPSSDLGRQIRQGGRVLDQRSRRPLAFYDFPAEHWKHLRTTNVIEGSFATVRHRTVRSKDV